MIFKLEDPEDDSVDWLFIITVGDGKLSLILDTFHELTNLTTETPITFGAKLDCGDLASMKVCENHKVRGEGVPLTLTEIKREYKATPNAPQIVTEDEPVECNCVRAVTLVMEGERNDTTLLRLSESRETEKTKSDDRDDVTTGLRHNIRVSDFQLLALHADAPTRERWLTCSAAKKEPVIVIAEFPVYIVAKPAADPLTKPSEVIGLG